MLKISSLNPVDTIKYEKYLHFEAPTVALNILGIHTVQAVTEGKLIAYSNRLDDLMISLSGGNLISYSKDSFLYLLTKMYNIPEKIFTIPGRNNLSLDSKEVLKPLREWLEKNQNQNPAYVDLIDLVDAYEKYNSTKHVNGSLKSLANRISNCQTVPGATGTDLAILPFQYKRRQNCRYYTTDPNVQGLSKTANWCLQAPEGYILVGADGAQADLRIACETILNRDENFRKVYDEERTDKYRAVARYVKQLNNQEFNEEEFAAIRPAYKRSILAAIYGARSETSLDGFKNPADRQQLISFIENNPGYKEYDANFTSALASHADVLRVYSIFGSITEWDTSTHNIDEEIRNSPIQSTTSNILAIWSMAVLDKFYSLGYSEKEVQIYLNRHDEIIFMISERAFQDAWIFKDYASVAIDDWDEFLFEPHFYFNYKEENEVLNKMYNNICERNKDKIGAFERQYNAKRKYDFVGSSIKVYSYAPIVLPLYLIKIAETHDLDVSALTSLPRSAMQERMEVAKTMARQLMEDPTTSPAVIIDLSRFKKYYDIYAIEISQNEYKYLKGRPALDKYCRDNNIRIVTLYNVLMDNETIPISGITYCFKKQSIEYLRVILDPYVDTGNYANVNVSDISLGGVKSQVPSQTNLFASSAGKPQSVVASTTVVRMFANIAIYEDEVEAPSSVIKWV